MGRRHPRAAAFRSGAAVRSGDPPRRRQWLYMLPSAIDDIEMGVTDVLRGEDHVSNTAAADPDVRRARCRSRPRFAHEALLVGSEGKLSKRLGSLGVDAFRERGIEPEALVALLARLGTRDPVEPVADRGALIESFDLRQFRPRAGAVRRGRTGAAQRRRSSTSCLSTRVARSPARRDGRGGWEAIRPESGARRRGGGLVAGRDRAGRSARVRRRGRAPIWREAAHAG